jgi:hypothetical protein
MKHNVTNALVLALVFGGAATASGCASSDDDDVDDGDGSGSNKGPLTIDGQFDLQSEYDIVSNLPGTAGTAINYFLQATDDPDDPARFIVEQIAHRLPPGPVRDVVQGSIPLIAGFLNDKLLEIAPDFVPRIIEIGDAFGQVAKHFGTLETVDLRSWGPALKQVTGLHFNVNGSDLNYKFVEFNTPEIKVEGVAVTLEPSTGYLTFSQHQVPLKYGQVLRIAIDEAIIPMIDPTAQDLGDILVKYVNCQRVGQYVEEVLSLPGTAATIESFCHAGLEAAATTFYLQLNAIDDAAFELALTGTARGVDRDGDRSIDAIQNGVWTGNVTYSTLTAPLKDAKFFGAK